MTSEVQPFWFLIHDSVPVRHGQTLTDIAGRSVHRKPAADVGWLVERLSVIDPLTQRNHPIDQLRHCERIARLIIMAPETGLVPQQARVAVAAYSNGVLDGFYGFDATILEEDSDPFDASDLTAIAQVGWLHGRALRAWWSTRRAYLEMAFNAEGSSL
jgi:hypothetical protein